MLDPKCICCRSELDRVCRNKICEMYLEKQNFEMPGPERETLPDERSGITYKKEFHVKIRDKKTHDCYLTIGFYPDGRPGEIFITVGKIGSALRAALDCWAISTSVLIQCGMIDQVIEKFENQRFIPSGFTDDPDYRSVTSVIDWIVKKLKTIHENGGKYGTAETG